MAGAVKPALVFLVDAVIQVEMGSNLGGFLGIERRTLKGLEPQCQAGHQEFWWGSCLVLQDAWWTQILKLLRWGNPLLKGMNKTYEDGAITPYEPQTKWF